MTAESDLCIEPIKATDGVPMGIPGYPESYRFVIQIASVTVGNLLGTFVLGTGVLGGPRWVDITRYCEGVHWNRGGEPAARPIAGAANIRLNNDTGIFAPPRSTFFGPGTMCRIVVGDPTNLLPQFSGTTISWNEVSVGMEAYEYVDITVWEHSFLLSDVDDHALAGLVGGGETLTQRIDRLLTQAAWAFDRSIVSASAATFQASDFPNDVATELYRTLDSVEATMWPAKNGKLMIRDRAVGSGVHWTMSRADENPDSLITANDDERILSSVDLARVGGTSVTYTAVGVAGRYQRRSTNRTDLMTVAEASNADLARVANGMLGRGTQTYRPVTFAMESGQGANQSRLIIESDITDRVSLPHGEITFRKYPICGVEHDVQVAAAGIYWRTTFALDIEIDSSWILTSPALVGTARVGSSFVGVG